MMVIMFVVGLVFRLCLYMGMAHTGFTLYLYVQFQSVPWFKRNVFHALSFFPRLLRSLRILPSSLLTIGTSCCQSITVNPLFVIDRSLSLTQRLSRSVRFLVRTEKADEEGLWVTQEGEGPRPHVSVLMRSSCAPHDCS